MISNLLVQFYVGISLQKDNRAITNWCIRLGREAKLRSYNDYRELCKYPRVTNFDQISSDEKVQKELQRLYGHVDNIEL